MEVYTKEEMAGWERFYRANIINSVTGFKPVSLIGTSSANGQTNLGIFSSIVHIGSDPALVGYINRPRSAAPHTLTNIESTGRYTINHIQPSFLHQAHQTSAKYPEAISEFEAVGLTMQYLNNFQAPFVEESVVKYALTLQEIMSITVNNTFLVIGKIEFIYIQKGLLSSDGFIDLHKAETISSNGTDSCYTILPLTRLAYAKMDNNK
ncbi:MAG: flavin reductase [Chitinophagaceae bacterium]